ncbi:MAG: tetratricopeptide repeat protein [Candidatus Auribacterota bacterium]|nr:tetratricopeptide repeat protein [Candidatus Auribacterota bacterium]
MLRILFMMLIFAVITAGFTASGLRAQSPTGDPEKKGYNLLLLGKEAAEKGSLDDAISFLQKACDLLPENAEAIYYLGICYCRQGNYIRGIELLEESHARTLDPDILIPIKNAYFMNGLQLARNKQYDNAIKSFTRVVEIDPDDGKAYFNRGVSYMTRDDFENAVIDFDSAMKRGFTNVQMSFNRAVALEKLGRSQDAMEIYTKIVQDDPLFAPAHYNLAKLKEHGIFESGEYDRSARDAVYHYQRALEIDPSFYEAAFNISDIYYARGDLTVAIKWLRKSVELNEDFLQGYLYLAKLYIEKGAYNNALSQVEILEKKGYTLAEIKQLREKIYQMSGLTSSSPVENERDDGRN